MAKGYLGIEFGSSRIKIAEVKGDKLVKFIKEDMPENIVINGEIVAWDALIEFLKPLLKDNKFSTNRVALVVPDTLTYTRRLSMPIMTAQQLKVNLPYEFHDFIADDKDNYIYDYAIVGIEQDEEGNDVGMDVLAVAVSKELMSNYQALFQSLKLKLTMAAPQCLAFGSLIQHLHPEMSDKDFAVLDLGFSASRINIFSNGVFDTNRTIDIGCEDLAKRVADLLGCDEHIAALHLVQNTNNVMDSESIRDACGDIAVDVMRAMNYYTYEKRDNTLENIYVCGGGAMIPQLIEELRDSVPLNIVQLSDLASEDVDQDALTNGPAAIGICWNED
jgi:type IV pilus assembly protein PilM